jgi:hypothetical protein
VLAQDDVLDAERLLPGGAELAGAAAQRGGEERAAAGLLDDARRVGAEDDGVLRDGEALPDPDVEVVDRGGLDLEGELAGPGDGFGNVGDLEGLDAAGVETRTAFILSLYRVSPEDSQPAIRDSLFDRCIIAMARPPS